MLQAILVYTLRKLSRFIKLLWCCTEARFMVFDGPLFDAIIFEIPIVRYPSMKLLKKIAPRIWTVFYLIVHFLQILKFSRFLILRKRFFISLGFGTDISFIWFCLKSKKTFCHWGTVTTNSCPNFLVSFNSIECRRSWVRGDGSYSLLEAVIPKWIVQCYIRYEWPRILGTKEKNTCANVSRTPPVSRFIFFLFFFC